MTSLVLRRSLSTLTQQTTLNRVVVTGLGCVSPLGLELARVWRRLCNGETATQSLLTDVKYLETWPSTRNADDSEEVKRPNAASLPCTVAARLTQDSEEWLHVQQRFVPPELQRNAPEFVHVALMAAGLALSDASVDEASVDKTRIGVSVGSGIGSIQTVLDNARAYAERGYRRVSPHFVPSILANMAAGHVSMQHGLLGPNLSPSTACTTAAHAIGDAYRAIQLGDADVMLAGGAEMSVNPISIAGFCRLRALSTRFNDAPELASRPFDARRDGFVMGEGAGVLVLESMEHAVRRGARVYAEVCGYGTSGDASHVTAPSKDGRGAIAAMRAALCSSRGTVHVDDVKYVNAHATSTPLGDEIEKRAIAQLYQSSETVREPIFVSSSKGSVGHLLGAAGAVESIFTVLALHHRLAPPTANLEDVDGPEQTETRMLKEAEELPPGAAALCNSFGFGGPNASLLFRGDM